MFVFTPTATHAEIICDSLKQGIFVFNVLLEYMDQAEDLKKYKNIFDRKICDGGKTNSRNLLGHKNLLWHGGKPRGCTADFISKVNIPNFDSLKLMFYIDKNMYNYIMYSYTM